MPSSETSVDSNYDHDSNCDHGQSGVSADAPAHGGNNETEVRCDGGTPTATASEEATYEPGDYPEADLPQDFQTGLTALREHCPEATPVGKDGNNVLVWLGRFDLSGYDATYEQDAAEVFIFLPQHLPEGNPHWVVTAPELKRADTANGSLGEENNIKPNHNTANFVERECGVEDAAAWSVSWSNANLEPSKPDHMRRAYEIVNKQFDLG